MADNITRSLITEGRSPLFFYLESLSVTGLTSNPSLRPRDQEQQRLRRADQREDGEGLAGEELFFELALEE